MGGLNESLFRLINGGPDSLEPLMRFFSEGINQLWVRLILLALIAWLIKVGGSARLAAIQSLIAFPLANLTTDLFKAFAPAPRPCSELLNVLPHGIGCSGSMGTASAHSANMAAIAFVFVYHLRLKGTPWILVALLTGYSRVYHGAHYPSQVLLGWFCGLMIAFLVTTIGQRILLSRSNVNNLKSPDGQI